MNKILLLLATLTIFTTPIIAKQTFTTIGTGGVTGVYYPTGGAICRLVNKNRKKHGVRCSVESTGGSIYNLNTIRSGELDIGVAQSDWQYHAYYGTSKFQPYGKNKHLRSLFSIHAEPFTVLVRKDANIISFQDLKGKRVNIGNPGSGQRATMDVVMNTLGWTRKDFSFVSELKSSEQAKALCDNKVDAIIFTVGHPNGSIKEATTTCSTRLVNVDGIKIKKLIENNSYYRKAMIPGGMYNGNKKDIQTFGVGATLVTSDRISNKVIYEVVKAVFENFEQFRRLHPAFKNLKKEEMIRDGLTAPLHKGAIKYYKEANLL